MNGARQTRKAPARTSAKGWADERARLRRRIRELQAELAAGQRKQEWLETALAEQRHARQTLEASVSANYSDTIASLREVIRSAVPSDATVLVVSRGDEKLLELDGRRGWHFPRGADGGYAGYYPTDSGDAIRQVEGQLALGAQYILFPNTALWWLEHYREFEDYLRKSHLRVWRDARCALYKLSPANTNEVGTARRAVRLEPASPSVSNSKCEAGPAALKITTASAALYDVVCFPVIDWDFRYQRPQQLMSRFAAAGHRVFYLSHQFRRGGGLFDTRDRLKNLTEVFLRGPGFPMRDGLMDDDTRASLLKSIEALRADRSLTNVVAIAQLPFWWPLVKRCAKSFAWPVVCDCMDFHAGFSNAHPLTLELERDMLREADLVIASSSVLEAFCRKHNSNVALVRNGCDYEHFARVRSRPVGPRPVIGYYGAISEWFDADLVANLAERRPDWDFILVGSTLGANLGRLPRLPNVSLPGEKPYAEIPEWLEKFDVAILPFKRTPLTEATNPVKAYEIFAAGKPLVSVALPEMREFAPLVRFALTARQFEMAIGKELLAPDAVREAERRLTARNNTWEARRDALRAAVGGLLARRSQRAHPRAGARLVVGSGETSPFRKGI